MPIRWPARYEPDRVAARVSNEIDIAAPADTVWRWLVRAQSWPQWYPNSANVRIASGGRDLAAGDHFTWRTFGTGIRSTVEEFEPPYRIAWTGKAPLLDVYHAWLIEPRDGGCHVLTEENQNGLLARAQAMILPRRMFLGHQLWLQRLKERAESGERPL